MFLCDCLLLKKSKCKIRISVNEEYYCIAFSTCLCPQEFIKPIHKKENLDHLLSSLSLYLSLPTHCAPYPRSMYARSSQSHTPTNATTRLNSTFYCNVLYYSFQCFSLSSKFPPWAAHLGFFSLQTVRRRCKTVEGMVCCSRDSTF